MRTQRFPALGGRAWDVADPACSAFITNYQQVTEISIFSAVLLVQSLPFLSAVAVPLFERSSLNDFATWRKLAAALATYRPRLPRGPQPTAGPPASGDIGILP